MKNAAYSVTWTAWGSRNYDVRNSSYIIQLSPCTCRVLASRWQKSARADYCLPIRPWGSSIVPPAAQSELVFSPYAPGVPSCIPLAKVVPVRLLSPRAWGSL